MPEEEEKGLKIGNLLFAVAAFCLGAFLIYKGVESDEADTTLVIVGALFAVVAIVLGAEGGSSAIDNVKELVPFIHNVLGQTTNETPANSVTESGYNEIVPEEVTGAENLTNEEKAVLGFTKEPPTLARADTELIRDTLFETTVPTYILNQDFHILDWNPAFEVAFGVHCRKLRRQNHVTQLIHYLDDSAEIIRHGAEIFGGPVEPLVDFERLGYESPTYGRFEFGKITSRATHPITGETIGWNVVLNVQHVDKQAEYEAALRDALVKQVNWRVYATSYDRVLLRFSAYKELLRRHVDAVAARNSIVDLGAGTGNVTLELLKGGKEVVAVDYNEAMLVQLREKCSEFRSTNRLKIIKQNLDSMRISKVEQGKFDGAIMQNVLYALANPLRCLEMVYNALQPRGILVVSGPKIGTSLDALFTVIRKELQDTADWDSIEQDFENVLERNRELEGQGVLHQWTIEQVRELLESAGFKVMEEDNDVYAGQAMLLIAQRD